METPDTVTSQAWIVKTHLDGGGGSSTRSAVIRLQQTSLRFASLYMGFACRAYAAWLNVLHDVAAAPEKFDLICVRCCVRRGRGGEEGGLWRVFTSAPVFTVHWAADWRLPPSASLVFSLRKFRVDCLGLVVVQRRPRGQPGCVSLWWKVSCVTARWLWSLQWLLVPKK